MKASLLFYLLLINFSFAQKLEFKILLKDKINIRTIQIWKNKVYYAGNYSKIGFVSLKDSTYRRPKRISEENLEFRAMSQNNKSFYVVNVESPAYFFKIDKKYLTHEIVFKDTAKTAFYDAFMFDENQRGIAISDPKKNGKPNFRIISDKNYKKEIGITPKYNDGEAHFAASNSNIAMKGNNVWIATGGKTSRIFKFNWNKPFFWSIYNTPFVNGSVSTGIYSIDFYDEKFGIAVGGDYTKQKENKDNIATTFDGGETWQIQASGKNAGYMTCVKIRPKSKGKDIIAVGDQHISFSSDFGKTWIKISDEKNLYICQWIDENTIVFAGKDRILKAIFSD